MRHHDGGGDLPGRPLPRLCVEPPLEARLAVGHRAVEGRAAGARHFRPNARQEDDPASVVHGWPEALQQPSWAFVVDGHACRRGRGDEPLHLSPAIHEGLVAPLGRSDSPQPRGEPQEWPQDRFQATRCEMQDVGRGVARTLEVVDCDVDASWVAEICHERMHTNITHAVRHISTARRAA